MDKYLGSLLGEKEQIILETRQHWLVLIRNILVEGVAIFAIIALVSASAGFIFVDRPWGSLLWLGLLFIFPPIVSLIWDFLQWYNRKYVVTNRRVIQIAGVINKDVTDSSLEKVNDVKLVQSFFGRLLNYGDVQIMTASELGVNMFKRIGNPIRFKTTLVNAKEKMDYHEDGYNQRPVASKSLPDLLDQLDNLRQRGVLTEEEFLLKKAELLKKM